MDNGQLDHFSVMWQTQLLSVSASLPVYCHSSSYRYFKLDFKTLCTPVMPEYGFSCQHWRHYWCWNVFIVCLRCRRRDKVECHCWQTWNWDTDLHNIANIPFHFCFVFSLFCYFSSFVFSHFVCIWADFSVCVNGFIIFTLTNIFVSISVNEIHTALHTIHSQTVAYTGDAHWAALQAGLIAECGWAVRGWPQCWLWVGCHTSLWGLQSPQRKGKEGENQLVFLWQLEQKLVHCNLIRWFLSLANNSL